MDFLGGTEVLKAVIELVETRSRPVRAAFAYVGRDAAQFLPLKPGDVIVVNGGDNAVAAGSTDPWAVEEWLEHGARVVSHAWLHAKVIVAGDTAIVGSANLSERARSGGIVEAAVRTTDLKTALAVAQFVDDLIRDDGVDVDEHWVKHAKDRFPGPRRRPAPPWDEPRNPDDPFRLWLGWWNRPHTWTPAEREARAEATAELTPLLDPPARYELDHRLADVSELAWFHGNDMVIILDGDQAWLTRFLKARPVRKKVVTSFRWDTQHSGVPIPKVRKALTSVRMPAPDDANGGRWLTDPDERRAVLNL